MVANWFKRNANDNKKRWWTYIYEENFLGEVYVCVWSLFLCSSICLLSIYCRVSCFVLITQYAPICHVTHIFTIKIKNTKELNRPILFGYASLLCRSIHLVSTNSMVSVATAIGLLPQSGTAKRSIRNLIKRDLIVIFVYLAIIAIGHCLDIRVGALSHWHPYTGANEFPFVE